MQIIYITAITALVIIAIVVLFVCYYYQSRNSKWMISYGQSQGLALNISWQFDISAIPNTKATDYDFIVTTTTKTGNTDSYTAVSTDTGGSGNVVYTSSAVPDNFNRYTYNVTLTNTDVTNFVVQASYNNSIVSTNSDSFNVKLTPLKKCDCDTTNVICKLNGTDQIVLMGYNCTNSGTLTDFGPLRTNSTPNPVAVKIGNVLGNQGINATFKSYGIGDEIGTFQCAFMANAYGHNILSEDATTIGPLYVKFDDGKTVYVYKQDKSIFDVSKFELHDTPMWSSVKTYNVNNAQQKTSSNCPSFRSDTFINYNKTGTVPYPSTATAPTTIALTAGTVVTTTLVINGRYYSNSVYFDIGGIVPSWTLVNICENVATNLPITDASGKRLQIKDVFFGQNSTVTCGGTKITDCCFGNVQRMYDDVDQGNDIIISPSQYDAYFGKDPCPGYAKALRYMYRYI